MPRDLIKELERDDISVVSRLRTLNDILLITGNDYSDVLLNAAAEIERLRDALRQIADKGDDNEYGLHQAMRQMALDALREE